MTRITRSLIPTTVAKSCYTEIKRGVQDRGICALAFMDGLELLGAKLRRRAIDLRKSSTRGDALRAPEWQVHGTRNYSTSLAAHFIQWKCLPSAKVHTSQC